MIQDIFPHKLNNQYRPDAVPDMDSVILYFENDGVLCRGLKAESGQGNFDLPRYRECVEYSGLKEDFFFTYLFSVDEIMVFLMRQKKPVQLKETRSVGWDADIQVLPGFSVHTLRELRDAGGVPMHLMFAIYTGYQLSNWYRNNCYCGRCGKPMLPDGKERALRCTGCDQIVYPRINPAVIVGVIHGDKILLTKYRTGFPHYALVAGFTEIGETLEETVEREVMEETGLRVKNIRYYKSQPWGIADDLLAGFYCEADGSTEIHMDPSELKLAEWKRRDEIVLQPDDYSLTNEMMQRFKEGKEEDE